MTTMFLSISTNVHQRAKRIKLLIMDVDGVLTNAQLLIGNNGEIIKAFNTLDGHGIKMLQQSGVQTAIITARNDAAVHIRAQQLGIQHYFPNQANKKIAYERLRMQLNLDENECAFIGDDVLDLPIMIRCGLPVAVNNAHAFVKKYACYTTEKQGGFGAVRELCDLIMHAQDTLHIALDRYLQ